MRKTKHTATPSLTCTTRFRVRFSEVDSMHIVWHGNYALYIEDGREAFGCQYPGLGYGDIRASGYGAPIVDMQVQFRGPLRLGDEAVIETRYIDTDAAKICFEYEISRPDGTPVATAGTVQVFTDCRGELELVSPAFYLEWKRRWGVK
ncbi:MAG: acyl-CoA thioesterase [Alistipes sp.]|nr:acyl-CoA thioesterase [Alistipes sp.]